MPEVSMASAAAGQLPVDSLEALRRRRSAKWRTFPDDVLPLGLAEMDFAIAPDIATVLREAVERSDLGYASPRPELGEAFAAFAARRWAWDVEPSRVTAVTDVGVGVVEVLRVLTRPGDAVVISPPVYSPFFRWPGEVSARCLEVPLALGDDGYHLDLPALEIAFARHPAVYVLCNPHNPVGRAHPREELETLVDLALKYGVRIVSDEVFGPLSLPGVRFTPLLSVRRAGDVAVSILSASKAFNISGLKCAVIVAGSISIASVLQNLPSEISWRAGHLGVMASIAAFTNGDRWLDRLLATLYARRELLDTLISERVPSVSWHAPEAGYLAWLNLTALNSDLDLRGMFLTHGRIALDDGNDFGLGGRGHVRLNFATSPQILDQATAAMSVTISRLTGSPS
jgi:cysteine-S-conjugate beta-lyase